MHPHNNSNNMGGNKYNNNNKRGLAPSPPMKNGDYGNNNHHRPPPPTPPLNHQNQQHHLLSHNQNLNLPPPPPPPPPPRHNDPRWSVGTGSDNSTHHHQHHPHHHHHRHANNNSTNNTTINSATTSTSNNNNNNTGPHSSYHPHHSHTGHHQLPNSINSSPASGSSVPTPGPTNHHSQHHRHPLGSTNVRGGPVVGVGVRPGVGPGGPQHHHIPPGHPHHHRPPPSGNPLAVISPSHHPSLLHHHHHHHSSHNVNVNAMRHGHGHGHGSTPPPPPPLPHAALLMDPAIQEEMRVAEQRRQEEILKAWSEHDAPSGVKYYYNELTRESTYERPSGFIPPETSHSSTFTTPGGTGASSSATAISSSDISSVRSKKWKEYIDPTNRRRYYSDGLRAVWDRPPGFMETEVNTDSGTTTSSTAEPSIHPLRPHASAQSANLPSSSVATYTTKEDATSAFKALLVAKSVPPSMKWNEVVRLCSGDAVWNALSTAGERKQALAEYRTRRANEEREARRQRAQKEKEDLFQLLSEAERDKTMPQQTWGHLTYGAVAEIVTINKDRRWRDVEDVELREEWFYDFVEERRKKEERVRRAARKVAKEGFLSLLRERDDVHFHSSWSSFISSIDPAVTQDPRFVAVGTDSDRQKCFADHIADLKNIEDEKRRHARETKRRTEKNQRDAYRSLLRSVIAEGKITTLSRWRTVGSELISRDDPIVDAVARQDEDAPREIFEDLVEDLRDAYRRDKLFLSRVLGQADVVVDSKVSFDAFCRAVAGAAEKLGMGEEAKEVLGRTPVKTSRLFYDELVLRASAQSSFSFVNPGRRDGVMGPAGIGRRRSGVDDSEDEGEIVEDGEVREDGDNKVMDQEREKEVEGGVSTSAQSLEGKFEGQLDCRKDGGKDRSLPSRKRTRSYSEENLLKQITI
uniref:WW domain-containing protein n=1 Tax=Corethron hystrix TaxID=216773 RepID=A0A7S1BD05_9STRA